MNPLHIVCPQCLAVNRVPDAKLQAHPLCGNCKAQLFEGRPVEVSAAGFSRFLTKNSAPLVIDFWAPWCGPCKMMGPEFAKACQQLEPYVRCLKVNTEQESAIGAQFNIRSIPTLAIFAEGREVTRQAGALPSSEIVRWVRAQLT